MVLFPMIPTTMMQFPTTTSKGERNMEFQKGQVVLAMIDDGEWVVGIYNGVEIDAEGSAVVNVACGTRNIKAKKVKPVQESYPKVNLGGSIQPRYPIGTNVWYVNTNGKLHKAYVTAVEPIAYTYRLLDDKEVVDSMSEMQLVVAVDQAMNDYAEEIENLKREN